ncbi:MAG: TIGR03790 family protein [Planctomycetota bacterium]
MQIWKIFVIHSIILTAGTGYALEPNEILVIANSEVPASVRIAEYYCAKRRVPGRNVLALPLGTSLSETINRSDYEKMLAEPIRRKLSSFGFGERIRCLLTTYGVPIKVGGRGPLKGQEDRLKKLKESFEREKYKIEQLEQDGSAQPASRRKKEIRRRLTQLQSEIDGILGKETDASVDSELSMVLSGEYELYRWQPNRLENSVLDLSFSTLMVSRLDGPDEGVAKGLVDKAMAAEKAALKGAACIDSRGIEKSRKSYSPGYFDQSLRDLATLIKFRTAMAVKEERTEKLFEPGSCPRTVIYCGWYSLKKYIDAFDFVDGAIGYHISSWEAVDLRDPNSSQWCPAMLKDGITATLGAVAEPYLHSFPEPKAFFLELFNGRCLVEAFYYTKPFNSWQFVLIGDPLYRPFGTRR